MPLVTLFSFQFHSTSPHVAGVSSGLKLFSSADAFRAHLASWNRQGWSYYESEEDKSANAHSAAVPCYVLEGHAPAGEGAYLGPSTHHHVFVMRDSVARENAAIFGMSAADYETAATCGDRL